MNIKVNSKKAKVSLPKEVCNVVLTPKDGTNANAARHSKLGHPIPTVIHKNKIPINIPKTFIPSALKPEGAGAKKNIAIIRKAIIVKITSFSVLVIKGFFFVSSIKNPPLFKFKLY